MLLAVDVGNTEITIGVFEGDELAQHWRASTVAERTADEHALLLGGFLGQEGLGLEDADGVVVSSVVPRLTQALREMVRRYCHVAPLVTIAVKAIDAASARHAGLARCGRRPATDVAIRSRSSAGASSRGRRS